MFQTKWYVSQYSVTQRLAKLSYLETDLLTGLLLFPFTQQPFLNYPCKTHKTNNANGLILNHSVSLLTTHRAFESGPKSTKHYNSLKHFEWLWVRVRAVGLWYLSFMTLVLASHTGSLVWWPIRESVWVLARARGPGWHPGLRSVQLDGGQSVGLKIQSQLESHDLTGLHVQSVPFPEARGGLTGTLEKAAHTHN